MSAWFHLVIAGLLEVGWVLGLKHSAGFTRLVPSLLTVAGIAASLWLLAVASRTLPLGTAYAVWVGIGTIGTLLSSAFLYDEPLTPARLGFLGLLVISILGLKLVTP